MHPCIFSILFFLSVFDLYFIYIHSSFSILYSEFHCKREMSGISIYQSYITKLILFENLLYYIAIIMDLLNPFLKLFFNSIKTFFEFSGIYILWTLLHFAAANLYYRFCAELSFYGFIISIFVADSPHCIALRWIIFNSGSVIHSMWASIAIWISSKIFYNLFT